MNKFYLVVWAVSCFAMSATSARAVEIPEALKNKRVDFEIGGGFEATSGAGLGLLLEVSVVLTDKGQAEHVRLDDWIKGKKFHYYARVHGDWNAAWVGHPATPSWELDIVPIEQGFANGSDSDDLGVKLGERHMVQLEGAPIRMFRNVTGNQNFAFRVSVAGVEVDSTLPVRLGHITKGDQLYVVGSIAADAIGLKLVNHLYTPAAGIGFIPGPNGTQYPQLTQFPGVSFGAGSDFIGFHVGGATVSGGVAWLPNEAFTVKVLLGGTADLNFGSNIAGLAVQSDLKAFFAIKADIKKAIQLILELQRVVPVESNGLGGVGESRVMLGGAFLF